MEFAKRLGGAHLALIVMLSACSAPQAGRPSQPVAPTQAGVAATDTQLGRSPAARSESHPSRAKSCADSPLCRLAGFCAAQDGDCVAKRDTDCEQSSQCRTDGACAARAAECVAVNDQHCRQSEACQKERRCRAKDGYCVSG